MTIRQCFKTSQVILLLLIFWTGTLVSASVLAAGVSSGVKQMAAVLLQMHHFPSKVEAEILRSIIDDKSSRENERIIANAILNVKHKAEPSDVTALQTIINSKDATGNEKDLAISVINLNHEPTAKDKVRLESMK